MKNACPDPRLTCIVVMNMEKKSAGYDIPHIYKYIRAILVTCRSMDKIKN